MTLRLLDVVKTRNRVPDGLGGDRLLPAGSQGTVVLVHEAAPAAYDVEFLDAQGYTIGLVTLLDEELEAAG